MPNSGFTGMDRFTWTVSDGQDMAIFQGTTFADMVPELILVSNGYALADPARSKILYFLMGVNDTYDSGNGGDIVLQLSDLTDTYDATWFDPRTGQELSAGALSGGSNPPLTPPSTDDWILLLCKQPTGLQVGRYQTLEQSKVPFQHMAADNTLVTGGLNVEPPNLG